MAQASMRDTEREQVVWARTAGILFQGRYCLLKTLKPAVDNAERIHVIWVRVAEGRFLGQRQRSGRIAAVERAHYIKPRKRILNIRILGLQLQRPLDVGNAPIFF